MNSWISGNQSSQKKRPMLSWRLPPSMRYPLAPEHAALYSACSHSNSMCFTVTSEVFSCSVINIVASSMLKSQRHFSNMNSYRPISDQGFAWKIVEIIFDSRFSEPVERHSITALVLFVRISTKLLNWNGSDKKTRMPRIVYRQRTCRNPYYFRYVLKFG